MDTIKRIEDITTDDLAQQRWFLLQDEEVGFDAFEYVITEAHPNFSEDMIELEFAEFTFANGKVAYGIYDGFEAFNIMTPDNWYAFWYGADMPEAEELLRLKNFLVKSGYELPVVAKSKWTGVVKEYKGVQFLDEAGSVQEVNL